MRSLALFGFIRPPCTLGAVGDLHKRCLSSQATRMSCARGLYLHIPFCVQRCAYCAFAVQVSTRDEAHARYVQLVESEMRERRRLLKEQRVSQLSTVYLGGGTPSLISTQLLDRLLKSVDELFGIAQNAEITCEMDPATFDLQKAREFRHAGVNRVSVGVQSFDDELLKECGRIHNVNDAYTAFEQLHTAGFDNVSIDLISGLPGQTMQSWRRSLQSAVELNPAHISAYDLTLEPGTPFARRFRSGVSPLPSEDLTAQMIRVAGNVLQAAGYERYEISNYARVSDGETVSKYRSRHNLTYWRNNPFLAFGLGATSFVDGYRFARPRLMSQYRKYVESLAEDVRSGDTMESALNVLYPNCKPCSQRDVLEDFMINGFRLLVDGVSIAEMQEKFGETAANRFSKAVHGSGYLQGGLLELVHDTQRVRLTEAGALIENSVLSSLMQDSIWNYDANADLEKKTVVGIH